ncbi:hypothetical protein H4Q26_015406 [Puccinia striiformis f. sp. tritici PST-130]|nr:hypothetical protein H4Q26_015406 [Puccinia striiformis f. sp. tritici PST-130]
MIRIPKSLILCYRPNNERLLDIIGWLVPLPSSSDTWRTFIRSESTSEIESAHDAKKAGLTEHMRRKHKDAIKRDRKWGSNNKQPHKHSTSLGLVEDESDSSS